METEIIMLAVQDTKMENDWWTEMFFGRLEEDKGMFHIACIDEKKDRMPLHFLDAAYINGFFWVNALEWNAYYRINIETGYAEFLGTFKNAEPWSYLLFNHSINYEKFVFFIPGISEYLVRLDTENLDMVYYKLPTSIITEKQKFRAAVIYNNKVYMFPQRSDNICIFDIKKEIFTCDKNWAEEFSKFESRNIKDRFVQGCRINEEFFLANLSGNFFMRYNMNNRDYELIFLQSNEEKVLDITVLDKNRILILTWIGNVWSYNIYNGDKNLIYKYEGNIKFPFRHIIIQKEYFLLIPALEENILLFNNKEKKLIKYPNDWRKQYINIGVESVFNGYCKIGNSIWLYPSLGNMLLKLDTKKNTLSGIKINGKSNRSLQTFINAVDTKKDIENNYRETIKGYQIWEGVKNN